MEKKVTEIEKLQKDRETMINALTRIFELEVAHSQEYQMIAAHTLDLVNPRGNKDAP